MLHFDPLSSQYVQSDSMYSSILYPLNMLSNVYINILQAMPVYGNHKKHYNP